MLSAFQTELIAHINTAHYAKEYFGEIADRERLKMVKSKLPLVLVDFVGSDGEDAYAEDATFNLYLVHATYSGNETLRANTRISLLDFRRSVKRIVSQQSFGGSGPVEVKKTKKLLDAATDGAYLTVYTMTVRATVYDTEPLEGALTT